MRHMRIAALTLLIFMLFGASVALAITKEEFQTSCAEYVEGKIPADKFLKLCNDVIAKDAVGDNAYLSTAYAFRSNVHATKKDIKMAKADAEKAISLDATNVYAHMGLGNALIAEGKWTEAAAKAEDIARLTENPGFKEAMLQVASVLKLKAAAITPDDLWKPYKRDEKTADSQFKDKEITVHGKIADIGKTANGEPKISLSPDNYGGGHVVFEFSKDAEGQLNDLKKGQDIFIVGTCTGMHDKDVILKTPRILE